MFISDITFLLLIIFVLDRFMKNVLLILRYLTGTMFLLSGISKLMPIQVFELLIVSQSIVSWEFAPFLSRLIIGIELILGVGLFQKNFLKRFFIPATILMLAAFSFHLIYTMLTGIAGSNCGCFGEVLPMTPLEALIKNVMFIVILFVLYIKSEQYKHSDINLPAVISIVIMANMFIFFPVFGYEVPHNQEIINRVISKEHSLDENFPKVESIYTQFENGFGEGVDFNAGLTLVCVFSLDCEHCQASAGSLKSYSGELPDTYVLFLGEEEMVDNFFNVAGGTMPYVILTPEQFFPLLQSSPPRVSLLANGNLVGDWNGEEFVIDSLGMKLEQLR